jgi:hypothetical protein
MKGVTYHFIFRYNLLKVMDDNIFFAHYAHTCGMLGIIFQQFCSLRIQSDL